MKLKAPSKARIEGRDPSLTLFPQANSFQRSRLRVSEVRSQVVNVQLRPLA